MMQRKITPSLLKEFTNYLTDDEKSKATIEKYMRDIRHFIQYAVATPIDKTLILSYKSALEQEYAITSANSMLAALNTFLRFVGWNDLCVKQFRVQKKIYSSEEKELTKEEYTRLIRTASKTGNERLSLLIQTICGTGIRVSELQYITVEAIKKDEAVVSCKGKPEQSLLFRVCRKNCFDM